MRDDQRDYNQNATHGFTYPKGVHSYRYFLPSNSFVICSCIYVFCLRIAIRQPMCTPWRTHTGLIAYTMSPAMYALEANKRIGEYAWAGGKEFGVHIGWRKYLYEFTPFGYVNLWTGSWELSSPVFLCVLRIINVTWLVLWFVAILSRIGLAHDGWEEDCRKHQRESNKCPQVKSPTKNHSFLCRHQFVLVRAIKP